MALYWPNTSIFYILLCNLFNELLDMLRHELPLQHGMGDQFPTMVQM